MKEKESYALLLLFFCSRPIVNEVVDACVKYAVRCTLMQAVDDLVSTFNAMV